MNGIFANTVILLLFNTIFDFIMQSFGKKLRECRDAKNLSQSALAKLLNTNHSIIGKYERDEVKPTIDVVKKLAQALDTNVGYLLGETDNLNVLKDSSMLKRLNDIASFSKQEQEHILFALDAMITKIKLGSI